MSEHPGFWQEIIANPDDDTPRLIYADWLEEQGEIQRADFIRTQCQLEAASLDDPNYCDLFERDREIAFLPIPTDSLPELSSLHISEARSRGFHSEVVWLSEGFSRPSLIEDLNKIVHETPIRSLSLAVYDMNDVPEFDELEPLTNFSELNLSEYRWYDDSEINECVRSAFQAKTFRHLTKLQMEDVGTGADCQILAESENLNQLSHFTASFFQSSRDDLQALIQAPWFHGLRKLRVENDRNDDELIDLLISGEPFPHLTHLTLEGYGSKDPLSIQRLAECGKFPHLQSFSLTNCRLTDIALRKLLECGQGSLRELNLNNCNITSKTMRVLATLPEAKSLRILRIGNQPLSAAALKPLARSSTLNQLRILDISNVWVDAKAFRQFAASDSLEQLTTLCLSGYHYRAPELKVQDIEAFFQRLRLPSLKHLRLSGMPFYVRGSTAFAKWTESVDLRLLELMWTTITAKGARILFDSSHLPQLVNLNLTGSSVHSGVEPLLNSEVMPRLEYLNLFDCKVPKPLQKKLREARSMMIES